jgi:RNA exonuclease 1
VRYGTGAEPTASNGLGTGRHIRAAVAIDCEMGTAESGDTELIRVTMIDYFTREILVNNIVEPDVPLRNLNTRYSGVTWAHMRAAQRNHTSLNATPGARNAIWKFVGAQTIVVGHGVSNDLRSMKWIHENVVDSLVIEFNIKKRREDKEKKAEEEAIAKAKADGTYVEPVKETAVPGESANGLAKKPKKRKGGDLSLKALADRRLGRKIQLGEGTTGHDSLEDAIAARDLVHWHINNPDAT